MNWMQDGMDVKKRGVVVPGDQQEKGATMNKNIDIEYRLVAQIKDELALPPSEAGVIVEYLNRHGWLHDPEQVPGRTITRSEYRNIVDGAVKISGYEDDWERGFASGLSVAGMKVVPDPTPTKAEQDGAWWIEKANVNDAEDCEACEGDLCPVHHGMAVGIELMARKITSLGDDPELLGLIPDPVKAPVAHDQCAHAD